LILGVYFKTTLLNERLITRATVFKHLKYIIERIVKYTYRGYI